MPYYQFIHPNGKSTIDVFFHMNDKKFFIDADGVEWNRVFTPTSFAFDTRIDPHDPKAFVRKTEKGGTFGSIMDLSKELSERRGGDKGDELKVKYDKKRKEELKKRKKEQTLAEQKKAFEQFKKLDKSKKRK